MKLSHLDEWGRAKMVDISAKEVTLREARAEVWVTMRPETLRMVVEGGVEKGDVLSASRLAGIMAAKRTAELIPLCHPLDISSVAVDFSPVLEAGLLRIGTSVRLRGQTGAEMEALVAAAVSALTVYDMVKAVDRAVVISGLRLLEKKGGKSGHWKAPEGRGEVVAVNLAEKRGIPKRNVGEALLREDWGVEGDAHAGSERQVSLLPLEAMALAPSEVLQTLTEGEYSENLTIRGIPLEHLRVGTKLQVGEAVVEILQIGKGKLEEAGRPWLVSREGRFGRVLKGGKVRVGDEVRVIEGWSSSR